MRSKKNIYRVLFCSTGLAFGGEQKQLGKVLQHLDRHYFEPIICSIRPFFNIDADIRNSGADIICLQVKSAYNFFRAVRGLLQIIKERDIDLIQMNIFGSEFAGLFAAVLTRTPVVAFLTTIYDYKARTAAMNTKNLTQQIKWRVICSVHAILARVANIHYIAYTETIKHSAISNFHLPQTKITVIPVGLDLDEFNGSYLHQDMVMGLKEELNLDGAYPILLNVARISPAKGQKALLEAMPYILKRFPNTKLLLAGDGPLLDELTRLRDDLGLRKYVQLLGRRDDIAALLASSDIFVFSSYYEGLPGAIIEAMAAGKPVVAFDIPPLKEIVHNKLTGLLVNGRNVEAFAEAVIRLAEKREEASNMGEQARRTARKQFDVKLNLKKLEEIYKGVSLLR